MCWVIKDSDAGYNNYDDGGKILVGVSGSGICPLENPILLEAAVWKRCSSHDLLKSSEAQDAKTSGKYGLCVLLITHTL